MTRDLRRVSERSHRIDGILYLYGRDVRRGTRIEGATILDVAPTVLALAACHPRSTCRAGPDRCRHLARRNADGRELRRRPDGDRPPIAWRSRRPSADASRRSRTRSGTTLGAGGDGRAHAAPPFRRLAGGARRGRRGAGASRARRAHDGCPDHGRPVMPRRSPGSAHRDRASRRPSCGRRPQASLRDRRPVVAG